MICFKIIHEGEEILVTTQIREYRDLRQLIQDRLYMDGFGECGGVGRCATCMVSVEEPGRLLSLERNEETTLQKVNHVSGTRLSCQIMIDDELSNLTFRI